MGVVMSSEPLVTFTLDPRLQRDTVLICEWPLSSVLLMNDARYPWLVLVPRRNATREIFELDADDQAQLGRESLRLTQQMSGYFSAHKMNVAAIGNIVSQLHIHHVARFPNDQTWPGPVWGAGSAIPYKDADLAQVIERLQHLLA